MKKFIVQSILWAILLTPFSVSAYDQSTAQTYLLAHPDNPWGTIALAAVGENPSSDYLKSINGSSAIEYAAPILAITSLDQDPRTFGDKNLVEELEKFHTNNQIGDESTINDDIFGLLALISSGVNDTATTDAENFILAHQQANGGWGFSTNGGTDSNTTAATIVALRAAGFPKNETAIENGLNYLKTTQNDDGGFTYDPESPWGTDSDSSSTAWVIWALNATEENLADWLKGDDSPVSYLESNQDQSGFFKYQSSSSEDAFSVTTTAYAVIALSGNTLPVNKISPPAHRSSGGGSGRKPQVLSAITFAQGTLVKTVDSPTVYIVENDKYRPFSSESIFWSYGLKFSDVQFISSDIITADNLGPIMDYPDGTPHE